jgi:hypothetical protein
MLTFKQYLEEMLRANEIEHHNPETLDEGTKIQWNTDLENEIVKKHVEGIRKARETGGNWGIHDLADAVGINHQTLRRHILIPRKYKEITQRLGLDEPLRQGKNAKIKNKFRKPVSSPTALKSAAEDIKSGETSLRKIHQRFPSAKPYHVRQDVKRYL